MNETIWSKRYGLSRREVARRARVAHVTLRSWERGEKSPTLDNLRAVADALGEPLQEIAALLDECAATTA